MPVILNPFSVTATHIRCAAEVGNSTLTLASASGMLLSLLADMSTTMVDVIQL